MATKNDLMDTHYAFYVIFYRFFFFFIFQFSIASPCAIRLLSVHDVMHHSNNVNNINFR